MRGAGSGGRTRILTVHASRPPRRAPPCHANLSQAVAVQELLKSNVLSKVRLWLPFPAKRSGSPVRSGTRSRETGLLLEMHRARAPGSQRVELDGYPKSTPPPFLAAGAGDATRKVELSTDKNGAKNSKMVAGRVIQPRGSSTQPAADTARPGEALPKLRKQPQCSAPPPRKPPSRGVAEAEAQADARPSARAGGGAAEEAAQLVAGVLLEVAAAEGGGAVARPTARSGASAFCRTKTGMVHKGKGSGAGATKMTKPRAVARLTVALARAGDGVQQEATRRRGRARSHARSAKRFSQCCNSHPISVAKRTAFHTGARRTRKPCSSIAKPAWRSRQ